MHATLYLTPAATVKVAQDRVTRWLAIEDGGSRLDVFLGHTPEETIAACDRLGAALAECREAAARRRDGGRVILQSTGIVHDPQSVTYRFVVADEPPITESEQRALAGDR